MHLQDQPTLITGTAAGFGRALAERLLQEGARVAALDCDRERLDALASAHPELLAIPCDVADPAQVEQAVRQVADTFGGIRILVNNAGIMRSAPLINPLNRADPRHPLDLWQQVMDVNLNSVFYLSRAVAAIAPGFCDTTGTADALEAAQLARWVDQVPLKRMGRVEEVVEALLWILRADYFNGRVLELDGGLRKMNRVTKDGGKVVIGDESMPDWLRETEFGKILMNSNPHYIVIPFR